MYFSLLALRRCMYLMFNKNCTICTKKIKRKKNHELSLAKATYSYVKHSLIFQQVKNNALEACECGYVQYKT